MVAGRTESTEQKNSLSWLSDFPSAYISMFWQKKPVSWWMVLLRAELRYNFRFDQEIIC